MANLLRLWFTSAAVLPNEMVHVDSLVYDALEEIFTYLEAKDLVTCQKVCRRWNYVIDSRPIWKKLLERKFQSSKYWRKSWEEMNLSADQIEEFCLTVSEKLEQVDNNWRSGTFRLSLLKDFEPEKWYTVFHMSDDYILYQPVFPSPDYCLLNRHTSQVKRMLIDPCWLCCAAIHQHLLICGGQKTIKIFDAKTSQELNQLIEPNEWEIRSLTFGCRDLLLTGSSNSSECQLTVWRMKSPLELTYLCHWKFEGNNIKLTMDHQYIIVTITKYLVDKSSPWRQLPTSELHFISTPKLSVERSFCTHLDRIEYHQGLISLFSRGNCIQIVNISSGQRRQELKLQYSTKMSFIFKFHSNLLVTVEYEDQSSLFHVYDLKASKETDGDSDSTLLSSIRLPEIIVRRLECDETYLSCVATDTETGKDVVATLNFENTF